MIEFKCEDSIFLVLYCESGGKYIGGAYSTEKEAKMAAKSLIPRPKSMREEQYEGLLYGSIQEIPLGKVDPIYIGEA